MCVCVCVLVYILKKYLLYMCRLAIQCKRAMERVMDRTDVRSRQEMVMTFRPRSDGAAEKRIAPQICRQDMRNRTHSRIQVPAGHTGSNPLHEI